MCHSYICTLLATYTVQCVQGGEVENKLCDRVEGFSVTAVHMVSLLE